MNLANYDRTFVSTAEIIAAFFTNVFVNKLYVIALGEFRNDKHKSITDAFKRVASNYAQGASRNYKHYKSVINLLHAYYQDKTRYHAIVFSDFEDNILRQFIPEEYFDDFTSKEKDKTLYDIIIKVIHNTYMELLKPDMLAGIIDDRRDNTYALILKDKIISLLALQHEEYYAKFATKISEKSCTVSLEVAQKLKAALVEETKRRCEIEAEKDKAIGIICQLVEKIKQLQGAVPTPVQKYDEPKVLPKSLPIETKIPQKSPLEAKIMPKVSPVVQKIEKIPPLEEPRISPDPPQRASMYNLFDDADIIDDATDIGFGQ